MTQRLLLQALFASIFLISLSQSTLMPGAYVYYDPFTGEPAPISEKTSPVNPSCASAVANVNSAMTKLVQDLKVETFQSDLYAEFDAITEASSSLKTSCKGKSFNLVNTGDIGFNATQDLACDKLTEMFVSLLGKKEAASFKGAFEVVARGKKLGSYLGDNCQPVLVARKADGKDASLGKSVGSLAKSSYDASVEAAKTNLRISQDFQKKGIEMVFGKDKTADDNASSVDINSEEIL